MSRHWERLLLVLGVCVPIPLLAASGLTIPLPAVVERIAASLVPFADAAALDSNRALASGTRGSIVLLGTNPSDAPQEGGLAEASQAAGREEQTTAESSPNAPGDESPGGGDGPVGPQARPSDDPNDPERDPGDTPGRTPASEPSQEPQEEPGEVPVNGPSQESQDTPGEEPKDEPGQGPQDEPAEEPKDEAEPVEDTVNEIGETTEGVLDEVTETVDDVADTGDLDDAVDKVAGKVVPPLGG